MLSLQTLGLIARSVSTLATNIMFGGSLYGSAVVVPARRNCSTALGKLEAFRNSHDLSRNLMVVAWLTSVPTAIFGWYVDSNPQAWLMMANQFCLLLINMWTIPVLLPINSGLMAAGAEKKENSWIEHQVEKWGQANLVRTFLSGVAAVLCSVYWANRSDPFL